MLGSMSHRRPHLDLTAWLDRHGYRHSHARSQKTPHPYATKTRKAVDNDEIARAREISARRIAALISNGEDVRNSPAWRDALHESRMIDLMSRARAGTAGHRIGTRRSGHTRVDIRWYAIPNQNATSGGFLPMIEEDGKKRGSTWSDRGYAKAEAESMAEARAHEAASRFVGDWDIVVKKGRPATR
jgi:hypothetical protein